ILEKLQLVGANVHRESEEKSKPTPPQKKALEKESSSFQPAHSHLEEISCIIALGLDGERSTLFDDPIFRQFVPLLEEAKKVSGFHMEPVADSCFQKSERLLQKYESRALIVTTGACAMNCRFCFRQNYPYEEFALLEQSPFEKEVDIPHLQRIRIHSRFPIGIPERIDDGFCNLLSASRAQIIFVLHINHAKEIDQDIIEAMRQIGLRGVPMLSQTVLLKGVNDTLETLVELMSQLGNIGIIPYYLHQLDRVEGAHHFEVSVETGKRLIEEMKSQLSGYLVPRIVCLRSSLSFLFFIQITLFAHELQAHPSGMVWIPAGSFWMGCDSTDAKSDEQPIHLVQLDGFWMDETCVTNEQFAKFVAAIWVCYYRRKGHAPRQRDSSLLLYF
ncbi:hypothetical protein ACTFIY_002706, partial [Dictyostelium cf. discoideum]